MYTCCGFSAPSNGFVPPPRTACPTCASASHAMLLVGMLIAA
jgi:hypothetical protein